MLVINALPGNTLLCTLAIALLAGCGVVSAQVPSTPRQAFLIGGIQEGTQFTSTVDTNFQELKTCLRPSWSIREYRNNLKVPGAVRTDRNGLLDFRSTLESIRSGEVFIYINADGTERNKGQKTHSIVVANESMFDLDELEMPLRTLLARGVKVTLFDGTCYSGATQAFADMPGLCVITAATQNYLAVLPSFRSLDQFEQALIHSLNNPAIRTMEDAFLYASYLDGYNYPQASSLKTPDLEFFEYFLNSFDPQSFYRGQAGYECQSCFEKDYSSQLQAEVESMTDYGGVQLAALREGLKQRIVDFLQPYKMISRVAYQLAAQPGRPVVDTGVGGLSRSDLQTKYKSLEKEVLQKSSDILRQRARLYYRYQTGQTDYREGVKALRRRNSACEDFTIR